jgi:hypothetical protein
MDVNGKAASLELYLGRAGLTRGHELRPVRWTGFVQEAHAYQGEVEEKNKIVEDFIEGLGGHNSLSARSAYPELVSVWRAIFGAVSACAEDAQRNSPPPFEW